MPPKRGRGSAPRKGTYGVGGPGAKPDTTPVRSGDSVKRRPGVEAGEWPGHRRQGGPSAPVTRPTKVDQWIYDQSLASREPIKYVRGVLRKYGQRLNGPDYREFDEVRSPQSADGIAGVQGFDPISQALADIRGARVNGPGPQVAPRRFDNPGEPPPSRPIEPMTIDEFRAKWGQGLGSQLNRPAPLTYAQLPALAAAIEAARSPVVEQARRRVLGDNPTAPRRDVPQGPASPFNRRRPTGYGEAQPRIGTGRGFRGF